MYVKYQLTLYAYRAQYVHGRVIELRAGEGKLFVYAMGLEKPVREKEKGIKGGRVMIAFFVNYSTVAFPPHLPMLK